MPLNVSCRQQPKDGFLFLACQGMAGISRSVRLIRLISVSFQNNQLPVGHAELEQVRQCQARDIAQEHPDHPGMGHKERDSGIPEALIEKRQCPVLEVQKAFPARGPEGIQVVSPPFESVRILPSDLFKRSAVPLSQMDFIQCRVGNDGPVPGDDPGGMPAPGEAAAVNGVDGQGGQDLLPVAGLGDADVIQGRVRAADETLFTGPLDPAMPQQEDQAVSLRVFL